VSEVISKQIATGRKYVRIYGGARSRNSPEMQTHRRNILANEHRRNPTSAHRLRSPRRAGKLVFKLIGKFPCSARTSELQVSAKGWPLVDARRVKTILAHKRSSGRAERCRARGNDRADLVRTCRHKTMRGASTSTGPTVVSSRQSFKGETISSTRNHLRPPPLACCLKDQRRVIASTNQWL